MKIGNIDIVNPKIGTTEINKVFLGLNKVWERLSFLLDGLTGSTAAFSLRKLKSSYVGNAIQVRRASDNTTQDIGFVNNQLDVTSLNTFCSGTDGFISIWYNQSDTNNNLVQAASNNQPIIYDSSNGIYLENGNPTIVFNTSLYLEATNSLFLDLQDVISSFAVLKSTSLATQVFFDKSHTGNGMYFSFYGGNGTLQNHYDGYTSFLFSSPPRNNQHILHSHFNNLGLLGIKTYVNSNLEFENTTSADMVGTNSYKFRLGGNTRFSTWWLRGNIQEVLFFGNDQTANKTIIEDNINTNYSIY